MALNVYLHLTANGTAVDYRLDDVKLNGRAIHSLGDLNAPGRLDFAASPVGKSQKTIIGGFKSLSGMSTEMEVADPRRPEDGLVFTGRVMSAVSKIDGMALKAREQVSVAIDKPQNRRVVFVPAEKN
jgi:hypothetical protein